MIEVFLLTKKGCFIMKKFLNYLLIILLLITFTSCNNKANTEDSTKVDSKKIDSSDNLAIAVKGETYPLIVKDYLKNEITLEKKPEKVAVLSGTPLNIWYDLEGKSICTSNISKNVKLIPKYKEEIMNLPNVGAVYSIDMEAIIALKPDLIIAQVGTQAAQAKKLKEMGFNVINTHVKGYDDVIATYKAFGKILEKEERAKQCINKLENSKKTIIDKLPKENNSVVILYVTSKSLSVKLNNSIAGDVANCLNLKNIASDLVPDTVGSETAPLDIEYIVKKNPDYILVTSMISSNEEAKRTLEEQFKKNPAWSGIKAISEGRVIYLPQEYYLFNAGPYYNEAIEYMARGIYPHIYGEVKDWYGK